MKSRFVSLAVTNRKIDILAREVDMMRLGADSEIDLGMNFGEAAEPMNEPLGGEIRGNADSKRAGALPLQQPFGSVGDAIEGIAHDSKIGASSLSDDQPLPLAIKKFQPKLRLQRFHLMADSSLRDEQFFGSARETLVPRRSLEGLESIKRWHSAWHVCLMRKIGARSRNDTLRVASKCTSFPINSSATLDPSSNRIPKNAHEISRADTPWTKALAHRRRDCRLSLVTYTRALQSDQASSRYGGPGEPRRPAAGRHRSYAQRR